MTVHCEVTRNMQKNLWAVRIVVDNHLEGYRYFKDEETAISFAKLHETH